MRVYLDNCCFNRPFDDQSYVSIYVETEAKLEIQRLVRNRKLDLVWSVVLDYENGKNPCQEAKMMIFPWRWLATSIIHDSSEMRTYGHLFQEKGLHALDALHVACSVIGQCEYFITVDKGILKKRDLFSEIAIVTPIDFISIWESNHEN